MRIEILGSDGPLAQATRLSLAQRGHEIVASGGECAVCFPATNDKVRDWAAHGGYRRMVVRSHAYAYGSSDKNPGMMTEERVSLLRGDPAGQKWLDLEMAASSHPNCAIVRLSNVLAPEEGDLVVRKLSQSAAAALAGYDPNMQFLSLESAAQALVAACESEAAGLFNAAGEGAVPLKKAFAAAGTKRIALPKPLAGRELDQLQFNWTVSSERARRELNWQARPSADALADFLGGKPFSRPELLRAGFDDWGLDPAYIRAWGAWFRFLRTIYWRIDHEGLENIPAAGRCIFVSNHRGFMPLDAVMHLSLILTHRRRITRFLIIPSLLRAPFLSNFLTKLGGVIASQENAAKLLEAENVVGIFPEGIRGAFTPYRDAYRLRDFTKTGFARIAIENRTPITPAVVVGHAEIFPIIGRIEWSYLTREWGWPYLPIAPMFPLAPIPLPSKWHVRVLEPIPLEGLTPADAGNASLVKDFSRRVQEIMQRNIDEMVSRRKYIFWGRVLNRPMPAAHASRLQSDAAARNSR